MYMKYRIVILAFTLMLIAGSDFSLSGQGYVITHYDARDGIGHDNVRTIVADSSGFVWMATWDGLTRYDGTDFVNYFHNPADSTSLPYFSVSHIVIDGDDNLWIFTDTGLLARFNRATEEFILVRSLGGVLLNDLTYFQQGPDGYIWFLLGKGLLRYYPATAETIFYPWKSNREGLSPITYYGYRLTFGKNCEPWLVGGDVIEAATGRDETTGEYFAEVKRIYPLERLPGRVGIFFNYAGSASIVTDSEKNTWLASLTGLFMLDRGKGLFREHGGNFEKISFNENRPVVFYNHESGLQIVQPGIDSVLTIPKTICGLPASYFFYDKGMLWLSHSMEGGTPSGVLKIIFTPSEFRYINPFPLESSELNVFGIVRDANEGLWIAARDRNYLIRTDSTGHSERINILNDKELTELWHPRSFLADSSSVWIGYFYNKLLRYDLATGRLVEHNPARRVHTTCFDEEGKILIADSGIVRYDPLTRHTSRLLSTGDSITLFTFHRQDSILWAGGSHSQVLRYNLSTGEHEIIRIIRGTTNIEDICDGGNGILWLATLGSGVCRYDTSTGEKFFYTTASGLSNNTTYSILRDRQGNIWVSTNNGLSVINPVSGLIRSLGKNDGLVINEFNSDASWITREGKFLFGGVGGAVEFDPEDVLRERKIVSPRKIIILKLDVSAISRGLEKPAYKTDTIILKRGEDNFHISFVVPEYRHPYMIRYRYRLDGEGEQWNYTDHKDRNINYSKLRPGWHNLEIEATDVNGSWSSSRNLQIKLNPYAYQTKAFRVMAPLLTILLLSVIGWVIIKQLHQRARQNMDMLRHQALRGQMNPHFIFNALNSINYYISNNDRLSANRYIADFSKLIRTVLNNMNEEFVRLSVEMGALEDYLKIEHLRFGDKFDYSIDTEPGLQTDAIRVSPGIVQPFVENAIWHGIMGLTDRKGMIRIALRMRNNVLVCTVTDDGVGRARSESMKDKSLPKKSKGIALATERMKIMNNLLATDRKISITDLYPDKPETGTVVEIEMPVAN